MYAGLRDAWQYAGIEKAKDMFIKFCDWGLDEIADLDDNQMEQMTGTEFGGMNEIFADAYQITGDRKYIEAAKRFRHKDIPLNTHLAAQAVATATVRAYASFPSNVVKVLNILLVA